MSKLKNLREELNLIQEELSQKTRISVRTIQQIESGQVPKGYTLRVLAETWGVEEKELLYKKVKFEYEEGATKNETTIEKVMVIDYAKVKLLNLSSLPFVVLPF